MEILTKSNTEIIEWLIPSKLLRSTPPNCSKCLNPMKKRPKPACTDKIIFRCTKCGLSKSIRDGSFFANIKITLLQFMQLLIFWSL
jgi:hypothetical protein